jgi:hypothetical protein
MQPSKQSSRWWLVNLLVLTGAAATVGCATNGPSLGAAHPEDPSRITLDVRNNNWLDVRVYLVSESGARPLRIGTVRSMSTGSLRIPYAYGGQAALELRPIGTRTTYRTNPVFLTEGYRLELTVQPHLTHSYLSQRR